MALIRAAVGKVITSAEVNADIDLLELVPYTIMAKPVVPTSVAGAGVALGTRGKVTFTAATTMSLNGIFNSTYDTYKIILDISSTSVSATGSMRLRTGGVDSSGAVYGVQQTTAAAAAVATATGAANTSWSYSGASGTEHFIELTVNAPALARATRARLETDTWTGNVPTQTKSALRHSTASAYDGLTIIPSAGTITGSVTVFGFNTNT